MNKPLLATIMTILLMATTAEASTPDESAADRAYCHAVVAEQINERRRETAQNGMVDTAINILSGAMLGQDPGRSAVYAGRSAAYGAVSRTRMNQYQRRAMMQQCMMERKRDR